MRYVERHPLIMIVIGVLGIGMSAIFVKYSAAPSAVTAAWRLLWTVALMSPVDKDKKSVRKELRSTDKKTVILSLLSGVFLAVHFVLWFESLQHTTVAASTVIVCTEVIWVSIGFCLFMKGRITPKAILAIGITLVGSVLIALADMGAGGHLYGDVLSLLASVAVAVYMLLGRAVRENTSTTVYTYLVYSACAGGLLLLILVQGESLISHGPSAVIVGLLLSVFSTILVHSIFSWCLKYFSPSFVSASKLLEPVVAALFAVILFGEVPTLLQGIGAVIILAGVFYYSLLER